MKYFAWIATLFVLNAGAEPSPQAPKTQVLWDSWYTVTAAGGVPFGYYNDRFERKGDKIAFKNQFWKNEEGYINEEQVVAIASDDEFLTPEFWNFRSAYRASTIDIDGSVSSGSMSVKVREGKESSKPIKLSLQKKTFLSVMFPVWLSKRLPKMKPTQPISFQSIFEDSVDRKFQPMHGLARLAQPDDLAKASGTSKVTVDLDGKKSVWYVLPSGEPVKIEMTTHHLTVNRTTEASARRFLIKKE